MKMDSYDSNTLVRDTDEKLQLTCIINIQSGLFPELDESSTIPVHDALREKLDCRDNFRENEVHEQSLNADALDQRTLDEHGVSCIIQDSIPNSDPLLNHTDTSALEYVDPSAVTKEVETEEFSSLDKNTANENYFNDNVNGTNTEKIFEEHMECESTYRYPEINYLFTAPPAQLTASLTEFNSLSINNFLKGCKWSPDGSCILTNSEDHILRLFNLPAYEYQESLEEMEPALKITEGDLIYDYCWFPNMTSLDPITCCLASTCRDHPIHMWDAYTGELRCTYSAYNHLDEIVAAHCVTFDPFGTKLFCGFNKTIRVFDVERPGREFDERSTYKKKVGQPGIISCIAMCPVMEDVYAAGSYSKLVGIYSESNGELVCVLQGQLGGVTHVCFSPDGFKLYSGGRKDPEILCWDLRNPGKVLYTLMRDVVTNQRMYFDVNISGHYLATGHQGGKVTIWDTTVPTIESEDGEPIIPPLLEFDAHLDAVNGISFHRALPILATTSGQRKFADVTSSSEDSSDDELLTDKNIVKENSLRMWWLGSITND